jgi:serine/threonine-protein kinase
MNRASLQSGQVLDDTYRIVRRIGEGGMGEVYEAAHARLAGRYAIKLLQKDVAGDPGLMARFQREAQVTSSLRHPNIVQVVDFRKTSEGTSYIVMEYLDGVDLAAEIRGKGPLPLERVRDLVEQIATGLAAAHEQGIVHRDLKPANLFLLVLPGSRRELVKIVDFGISKVRAADTQLTRTATVMGTPQYMAPEQALGESDRIDARSDQFALATITYEMLAGRCAFVGDTIPTILYQLVHVEPAPLTMNGKAAHPAVEAVIRRGLAKQPEARFPSIIDFAQAFASAAAEATAAARAGGAGALTAMASAPTAMATGPVPAPAASGSPAGAAERSAASTAEIATVAPSRSRALKPAVAIGGAAALVVIAVIAVVAGTRGGSRAPAVAAAPGPKAEAPASRAMPVPAAGAGVAAAPPAREMKGEDQVTISVVDPPANLSVAIDGEVVGAPPVRLVRDSGRHELRFEAPGFRSRVMQLDSTKDMALVLSLKRRPGTAGARSAASASNPPPAGPARPATGAAAAYQPPDQTDPPYQPVSQSAPEAPPPERKKAGRFRHGVDAVSDFAKRHFGTAGSR